MNREDINPFRKKSILLSYPQEFCLIRIELSVFTQNRQKTNPITIESQSWHIHLLDQTVIKLPDIEACYLYITSFTTLAYT